MQNKHAALEPGTTYHIYNRANGNELLFYSDANYHYFLKKYSEYISPYTITYCYCLMPNHFHFILRIKEDSNLQGFMSRQFSNFFNAYTKALNKQQNRKGNLFMHTFKRKKIGNAVYLKKLVHYIHFNPVVGGLSSLPEDWKYSSYNAILSDKHSLIERNDVIEWFDDTENFIFIHQHLPRYTGIDGFS